MGAILMSNFLMRGHLMRMNLKGENGDNDASNGNDWLM